MFYLLFSSSFSYLFDITIILSHLLKLRNKFMKDSDSFVEQHTYHFEEPRINIINKLGI
jgi:hypothetical protein